ncbi:integrator complex subunit 9, partial [Schistosoma bovis]
MSSIFWETIDVILVSNTRSILGLPFLFENTNFRGKVFATEPVVKFGKILIDDLLCELDQLFESEVNSGYSDAKVNPGCSDLPNMWSGHEEGGMMSSIFWETIDVILVSNTRSILGLPFLFENTNFRGKVFATEPVVKFGKILIDDLLCELDQLFESEVNSGYSDAKVNKPSNPIDYLLNSGEFNWTKFYTRESVMKALDKIHLVAYHEPVDLFGLLTIKGLSAGYGIGSCNWIITSSTEKAKDNFNGTILPLFMHNRPSSGNNVDHIENTTNSTGSSSTAATTTSVGTMNSHSLQRIPSDSTTSTEIDLTCNRSSSIITTTTATIAQTTVSSSSSSGLVARSPIFFISNQVHVSLAYSNAYGEWLNSVKESVLYNADAPFLFQSLSTPSLSLSDTATVYWLPMEARIGAQQINQLVKRCGEPRLALILPQEVYDRPFDWNIKPICIKLQYDQLIGSNNPLDKNNSNNDNNKENDTEKKTDIKSLQIDANQSNNKYDTIKRKLSTTGNDGTLNIADDNKEEREQKVSQSDDSEINEKKRKCIALVNGMLTTRDEQFITKIHGIPYGQQICINLPDTRLEQVRLSTKLIQNIKPICIKLQYDQLIGSNNPLDKNNSNNDNNKENDTEKKTDIKSLQIDANQSNNKYDTIKRKLSTTGNDGTLNIADDNKEEREQKVSQSDDSEISEKKRKCIALVNGMLTTRDGKHWLIGKHEKVEPDIIRPVEDAIIRPMTPPTTTSTSVPATITTATTSSLNNASDQSKDSTLKSNMLDSEKRILVSCCDESSRINPHELIRKLTERGVTGAYLADSCTARQVYSRFSVYNTNKQSGPIQNEDVILFVPVVSLHNFGIYLNKLLKSLMDESAKKEQSFHSPGGEEIKLAVTQPDNDEPTFLKPPVAKKRKKTSK